MIQTIKVAPVNSLVLVCPPGGGIPPEPPLAPAPVPMVMASSSCLLVCCLPEVDGETQISLGAGEEVDPGYVPKFDGVIETPGGEINVENVPGEIYLRSKTTAPRTRVRIWQSHPKWPEVVRIGLN